MRLTRHAITKTAVVLASAAACLSLSACDFSVTFGDRGEEKQETGATERPDRTDESPANEQNRNGSDSSGSDSRNGSGSGSDSRNGSGSDSDSRNGSGAGSSSGSGGGYSSSGSRAGSTPRIKGHVLAASVKQAAEKRSGISGITVTCHDLLATRVGATTSCDMDVPGDRKYFPIAKVTGIDGTDVHYKLEFPGAHF